MARFRCRDCFGEAEIEYRSGIRSCSRCGSQSVQIAFSIEEIPDDDPFWDAFRDEAEESMQPTIHQMKKSQAS
jgi:predicted amidophosphoribosyltransferase